MAPTSKCRLHHVKEIKLDRTPEEIVNIGQKDTFLQKHFI